MRTSRIDRAAVEPFLAALRADGMGVDPDDGEWFGASDEETITGVARVQERAGYRLLDDVWVLPARRRGGFGTALVDALRSPGLWLLCDEDMVGFYERRGFEVAEPTAFPAPLAELCAAKGEWPRAHDHVHIAMRAPQ
jgi:GNAT superfamily N-acetyltransferase